MALHYRELIVWQKAMDLVVEIYKLAKSLPDKERFGLITQMQRAAVSIPSNIAEGHERRSRRDYRRFILFACGSIAELETQLAICERLGYTSADYLRPALGIADEVGRMLRAIERSLSIEPNKLEKA